jgi:hypothetical protein
MMFQQTERIPGLRRHRPRQLFRIHFDFRPWQEGARPAFAAQSLARRGRREIQQVLRPDLAKPFTEHNRLCGRRTKMALRVCVAVLRIFVADHEVTERR